MTRHHDENALDQFVSLTIVSLERYTPRPNCRVDQTSSSSSSSSSPPQVDPMGIIAIASARSGTSLARPDVREMRRR